MRPFTVAMVGDIHIDRDDPPSIFRHIRPLLELSDLRIGNYESAFSTTGSPDRAKPLQWANFRSHPRNAVALAGLFSAVSLASNH
ncbi:MAG TPA: CapA family protein, partial [Bacillota bacterium]